ncbi:disease resistance protein [Populus alba x Populus x berolinensis]|nr:disease resistance protein [Populus alba x Populus x berolinensis]
MRTGPRTAFLNLDSLFLENLDTLEKICHGQLMAESLGNLRILKVESCHRLKNLFSVSMARRLLRLEEITIIDCKIMEEVVAEESENDTADGEPIEFTQLRRLTLKRLPQFTSFHSDRRQKLLARDGRSKEIVAGNEVGTSMSLFNTKILFPNLEDLKLTSIKVEKIWPDQPAVQPPCVRNLASIAVESCSNLNYLLTSSMVESLAQLERLEIRNCESMEEIVVPEGIGEGKMLFPKLLRLKLNGLPKLTRFCTTNLLECHFLKELEIWKCPELKEFISTPSSAMSKPDNTKSALFDDKVAFPELEVFEISGMDNLRVIWHSELHSDSFCKLKTLQVRSGKNLLNIFPSTTQLRVVRLWNLPHLKHVWNRDPQGILSFHNLCTVDVRECPGLRSLFPASIALNLPQLEELLITTCGVEEIVAKDEGLEEGPEFLFPKVTGLHLRKLPELKRFYPGIHTSEWPRLKTLRVLLFRQVIDSIYLALLSMSELTLDVKVKNTNYNTSVASANASSTHPGHGPPRFLEYDVFPKLKDLKLSLINLEKLWQGPVLDMPSSFQNSTSLIVDACGRLKHVFSPSMVASLEKLKSLEICNCKAVEEIAVTDGCSDGGQRID